MDGTWRSAVHINWSILILPALHGCGDQLGGLEWRLPRHLDICRQFFRMGTGLRPTNQFVDGRIAISDVHVDRNVARDLAHLFQPRRAAPTGEGRDNCYRVHSPPVLGTQPIWT